MEQAEGSSADDVQVRERIQTIDVATDWIDRYQSVTKIRDLPDIYIDEPKELGGRNSGPTALETVLTAMNACSAMIAFVLKLEMGFDLQGLRFETQGYIDVRRVEMKRTGKKYSEVEPIANHFHRVVHRVYVSTSEPDERIDEFRREVERLCPLHCLFRDAGVPVDTEWIRES